MTCQSIKRFCALPIQEQTLFVKAVASLTLFGVLLRVVSFRRLLQSLNRGQSSCGTSNSLLPPTRVAFLVEVAVRYALPHPSCLTRSLALMWLLRRQSSQSELYIGVKKECGNFEAHAWVSHAGEVLNDRPDVGDHFATFQTFDKKTFPGC